MSTEWVPLFERDADGGQEYLDTLFEGVPRHMERSLADWMRNAIGDDHEVIRRMERRLRISFRSGYPVDAQNELWSTPLDEDVILKVTDWLLLDLVERNRKRGQSDSGVLASHIDVLRALSALTTCLQESGSAWKVRGEPYVHLTRRVDPTLQAQVDAVVSTGSRSAKELATAWAHAFGRQPDLAQAYRHAVSAVEAEAIAVFSPDDKQPTLGKAISNLANVVDRYTVAGLDEKRSDTGATLLGMMRLLWDNERRHATNDASNEPELNEDQVLAAVTTAVTLVQWFQAGLVRKI